MSNMPCDDEGRSSGLFSSYPPSVCTVLCREVFASAERVSGARVKCESEPALEGTMLDSQRRRGTGGTFPLVFGFGQR